MTTRGFCACCGMPECIIDGTDGRECFHCGDGAPMPVAKAVARAVAAERARCAAVCREVAARQSAHLGCGAAESARDEADARSNAALECAEAIERGAVDHD